jgi:hypothetical protein
MLLNPGVEVKAVEGDAVASHRDHGEVGAYLALEDGAPHRAIGGRVTSANQSRRNHC